MTKFNPQRNSTVVAELKLLNPWVENTDYGDDVVQLARALLGDIGPISEKAHFEQRLATMGRFAAGRQTWNAWAQDMMDVRSLAVADPALSAVCDALAIANFSGACFTETVDFAALLFPGRADFSGSEFEADCWMQGSTFYGPAAFRQVSFMGDTNFERSTFYGTADFSNSMFSRQGQFRKFQVLGQAIFEHTDFARCAWFADAKMHEASFGKARFADAAAFTDCEFSGKASFERAWFQKSCGFEGAVFGQDVNFRDVDVAGAAWFSGAKFAQAAMFEGMTVAGGGDFADMFEPA
ncbi:MAG: pentapeptide repeat-containing protein [Filomicrobium sp.]